MTLTTVPIFILFIQCYVFNFLIVFIVKSGKLTKTFIPHQFIQFFDDIFKIVSKEVA